MAPAESRQPGQRERERDRGLAVAYERHCFYGLLEDWAVRYDVRTALEGPIDGIDGVPGVHGLCLARRGVKVLSLLPTASAAGTARAIYAAAGAAGAAEVRVEEPLRLAEDLPVCDMVIAYHALGAVADWSSYLGRLARLARRVLVLTVPNPARWRRGVVGGLAGLRGEGPDASSRTSALAPVLWEIGRVREHVYFDCPSWSGSRRSRRSGGDARFDYGPERWPYFGGPGWSDELLPALLAHPGLDGAETKLLPRIARMHAFVVDVRARTPQARKRSLLGAREPAP
jgi:hypothetical protein